MPRSRSLRIALAGTSFLTLAAVAMAQENTPATTDGGATVLEDIIVDGGSGGVIKADGYVGKSSATGAKTDTPFVQTPQSISSVTKDQLEDRNPQNLLDTLSYTPGTRVGAFGFDPRFDSFTVRGFDVTYSGIFRDNLRQPGTGSSIFKTEPYGIEGVSILRGPSSALYGASGPGGLYNLISKRPTEETLREVQAQYGSNNRYQGQFDLSGPVNDEDPVYYRLTGLFRDADTEQVGVPDNRIYIAPAFTWKPDEDTRLTILGEYSRTKTGGAAAFYNDPATGQVTDIFGGDPDYNDSIQNQGRIGYEFEHRLNDTFVFRQNARASRLNIDADWAFLSEPNALDSTLIDSDAGTFEEWLNAYNLDNQIEAKFSTGPLDHTLLTGIDFTKVYWKSLNGYGIAPPYDTNNPTASRPVSPIAFQTMDVQNQFNTGIYTQDQIRYDALTFTLGGRYDWANSDTDSTDLATGDVTTTEQRDRAFSWRAGVTYETEWGITPYASYSTAFLPNAGVSEQTHLPFKPTESEQKEIGVKYLLPDANVLLTAALFDIDQTDSLYYSYENVGGTMKNILVQRGELRSRGVELEATTSLDNGLSLIASYTYTQAKILDGPGGTVGNDISSIPRHMASLWGHYDMPEDGPFYGLGLGAGVRFLGSSYTGDDNSAKNGSRAFVDAAIDFDFAAIDKEYEGLKLQINATNLFDRRGTVCSSGYCYRDQGRTVIGTLKYTW
jgi:iron complex outermembrane receptor protein